MYSIIIEVTIQYCSFENVNCPTLTSQVSVSVTRVDTDSEETPTDPGGCFEEERFNISKNLRYNLGDI